MSVIAWDGKSIAADKQATCADMPRTTSKLIRLPNGEIAGITGDEAAGVLLIRWYTDGADPAKWPERQRTSDWTRLIVLGADGLKFYEQDPLPLRCHDEFMAFGSGRDFAMGAMAAGATAREAVEIACMLNIHCGMGVDEMTLSGEPVAEKAEPDPGIIVHGPVMPGVTGQVASMIRETITGLRAQGHDVQRLALSQLTVDALAQELGGFTSLWSQEHRKYMLDGVELLVMDGASQPRPLSPH